MTAETGFQRWRRWVREPGYLYFWLARRAAGLARLVRSPERLAAKLDHVNRWAVERGAARNRRYQEAYSANREGE